MKHIMIDLETLALTARAAIIQIGAVEFTPSPYDRNCGKKFLQNVDEESNRAWGRTISNETLKWWDKQGEEARQSLMSERTDLLNALLKFASWLPKEDYMVWSNGAAFDIPILENAFQGCFMEVPWKHYNVMCYRTMKNLFPSIVAEKFAGVKHLSVDDATHQAKHLMQILQKVL